MKIKRQQMAYFSSSTRVLFSQTHLYCLCSMFVALLSLLTCVDKVLVGQTWMIHVMNSGRKQAAQNLQGSKHTLQRLKLIKMNCGFLRFGFPYSFNM